VRSVGVGSSLLLEHLAQASPSPGPPPRGGASRRIEGPPLSRGEGGTELPGEGLEPSPLESRRGGGARARPDPPTGEPALPLPSPLGGGRGRAGPWLGGSLLRPRRAGPFRRPRFRHRNGTERALETPCSALARLSIGPRGSKLAQRSPMRLAAAPSVSPPPVARRLLRSLLPPRRGREVGVRPQRGWGGRERGPITPCTRALEGTPGGEPPGASPNDGPEGRSHVHSDAGRRGALLSRGPRPSGRGASAPCPTPPHRSPTPRGGRGRRRGMRQGARPPGLRVEVPPGGPPSP